MHDVALYLCSIFCTRSLVQFSTASYRVFERGTRPKLYLVTLSRVTVDGKDAILTEEHEIKLFNN